MQRWDWKMLFPQWLMFRMMTFWPPFLGAGIRVRKVAHDFSSIEVELKFHWWNRNYVGTQFGGALYMMCDPFFMLILMEKLGRGYIVWDKGATIRFKKPGLGPVRAKFEIAPERVAEIRAAADVGPKVEPVFTAQIVDREGVVIAEVEKLLYVKRKPERIAADGAGT